MYLTFILGSPALFRDCVEEEAEMRPEPLAELRSLPNDNEEPRPHLTLSVLAPRHISVAKKSNEA